MDPMLTTNFLQSHQFPRNAPYLDDTCRESLGESSNSEMTGTDRVTDIRTGSTLMGGGQNRRGFGLSVP